MQENDYTWPQSTFAAAALTGRLDLPEWLRANGCPWSKSACSVAALNGRLEILKWLRDNGWPWNTMDDDVRDLKAEEEHPDVVQFARMDSMPKVA